MRFDVYLEEIQAEDIKKITPLNPATIEIVCRQYVGEGHETHDLHIDISNYAGTLIAGRLVEILYGCDLNVLRKEHELLGEVRSLDKEVDDQ